MAYDEALATRVRDLLGPAVERRMFGGLAFMLDGHMTVCVTGDGLMTRIDTADLDALLAHDHVTQVEMGGRLMRAWVVVADEGLRTDDDLDAWLDRGRTTARSLPAKT